MTNQYWIYETDSNNFCRYSLGYCCKTPLLCVGVNPSTATPQKLDPTIRSVARIAHINNYDGWIMIILYPQRATKPNDMDFIMNDSICKQNLFVINSILNKYKITEIWAAWGTLITKRTYLKKCLSDIYSITSNYKWITFGPLSKAGHPHHPLYLSSNAQKENFDITSYISQLE